MTRRGKVADLIAAMTYDELIEFARSLVNMQSDAKESGWEWMPGELHGEFGLAQMLAAWAEGQDD